MKIIMFFISCIMLSFVGCNKQEPTNAVEYVNNLKVEQVYKIFVEGYDIKIFVEAENSARIICIKCLADIMAVSIVDFSSAEDLDMFKQPKSLGEKFKSLFFEDSVNVLVLSPETMKKVSELSLRADSKALGGDFMYELNKFVIGSYKGDFNPIFRKRDIRHEVFHSLIYLNRIHIPEDVNEDMAARFGASG